MPVLKIDILLIKQWDQLSSWHSDIRTTKSHICWLSSSLHLDFGC